MRQLRESLAEWIGEHRGDAIPSGENVHFFRFDNFVALTLMGATAQHCVGLRYSCDEMLAMMRDLHNNIIIRQSAQ